MAKRLVLFLAVALTLPLLVKAAAMNSENFRVGSDVIGIGGGLGTSETYKMNGTLGEMVVGEGGSETYNSQAGFWQSSGERLSLSCQAATVYMYDYTLGDSSDYSKYTFSTSEDCQIVDNTQVAWTLTVSSSDMTSARNTIPSSDILLATDSNVGSGDTITSPTANITEPAGPEYSLNTSRTIISGSSSASGVYNNQPTLKITDLNGLYAESVSGTITITLQ